MQFSVARDRPGLDFKPGSGGIELKIPGFGISRDPGSGFCKVILNISINYIIRFSGAT